MLLSSRGDKVMGLEFVGHAGVSNASFAKADNAASVQDQLDAYFAGSLTEFSLTTELVGCTDFQLRVLRECSQVDYGERLTYGQLAQQIGTPGGARAVGNALRTNPIALLIPCHRVTRADGSLGGYGGEDRQQRKKALLALEATS